MHNNGSIPIPNKTGVYLIYILGCLFWIPLWFLIISINEMQPLLWIPFIACFVILTFNTLLWYKNDDGEELSNYKKQLSKMQLIEKNAAHMVTAITGFLLIAAAISEMKIDAIIPKDAIMFASAALIFAVVGVLPKYWVPKNRGYWLVILRHLKTVPYTYAISLFLAGLLVLLNWLR